MNILYDGIIYSLQPQGGITRYANEIIKGVAQSEDVSVLMHRSRYNESPVNGVDCTPSLPLHGKVLKYLAMPCDAYLTNKYIASQKYAKGVFHSTYYTHYKALQIPQVITVHDMIHERFDHFNTITGRMFTKKKKDVIQKADHIICISEQTKQDLQELYGIPERNMTVIYHGVSTMFFESVTEHDRDEFRHVHDVQNPFLLFVGTRGAYKNFDNFITAYAAWNNADVHVVVAGGGELTKAEQKLVETLNIKNRVHVLGNVPDSQLRTAYAEAHALVFPTAYEGFGLPLLESFATGTPVIANDIPVFREIAGDLPLYIDAENQTSMISAFMSVAEKAYAYDAEKLQQHAAQFTWEKTVQQTIEAYKMLQ